MSQSVASARPTKAPRAVRTLPVRETARDTTPFHAESGWGRFRAGFGGHGARGRAPRSWEAPCGSPTSAEPPSSRPARPRPCREACRSWGEGSGCEPCVTRGGSRVANRGGVRSRAPGANRAGWRARRPGGVDRVGGSRSARESRAHALGEVGEHQLTPQLVHRGGIFHHVFRVLGHGGVVVLHRGGEDPGLGHLHRPGSEPRRALHVLRHRRGWTAARARRSQ